MSSFDWCEAKIFKYKNFIEDFKCVVERSGEEFLTRDVIRRIIIRLKYRKESIVVRI